MIRLSVSISHPLAPYVTPIWKILQQRSLSLVLSRCIELKRRPEWFAPNNIVNRVRFDVVTPPQVLRSNPFNFPIQRVVASPRDSSNCEQSLDFVIKRLVEIATHN